MNKLNGTTRTLRVITVALIGLTSLAVLGGCTAGGVKVASSTAIVTPAAPAAPAAPVTPVAPVTPITPPTFESDLTGVALNTVTNRFYVADAAGNGGPGTGEVLVFDAVTNQLLDTIAVGAFPTGIAVNAVTNTVYVASINSQSLSVIDGATNAVTATLTSVGTNPVAVAVNPVTNKVYVADDGGGEDSSGAPVQNLTVLDGATNMVTSQLAIGGLSAISLAVNSKTNTVYVANVVGLAVVDGSKDTLIATLGSTSLQATDPNFYGAYGVAVDESTNTVYVANESTTNGLTVINGATNTVTESIPLYVLNASGVPVQSPARTLAVNPVSHMVYITMETEDMTQGKYVFSVFNGATSTVLGTVGLDSRAMGIAVSATTGIVYAVESQEVGVINITNGTIGISVP